MLLVAFGLRFYDYFGRDWSPLPEFSVTLSITNTITLLAQVNRYWRRCWPVESLCRTSQQILKKPGKLNSLGVIDTRSQDTYLFGTVSFFFFEYFEICSKFRLSRLWRNLSSRAGYFDFHVCGLLIHRTFLWFCFHYSCGEKLVPRLWKVVSHCLVLTSD